MIGVGMMDRKVILFTRNEVTDASYGGINTISYTEQTERIFADVIWKGGKVDDEGNQMQNNQIIEFYVRNGGVMKEANIEDYLEYNSKKFYIDAINVIDGREKYLKVITTNVEV
jgi:hypothetical protein